MISDVQKVHMNNVAVMCMSKSHKCSAINIAGKVHMVMHVASTSDWLPDAIHMLDSSSS